MESEPGRREFLRSAAVAPLLAFGGCAVAEDGGETAQNGTNQSGTPEVEATSSVTSRGTGTRTDDLLVENFDGVSHCVRITVEKGQERVLDKQVDVPAVSGLVFGDIASPVTTYKVKATAGDGATETFDWTVNDCPGEGYDMNGAVRIRDGKLSFERNSCDAESVGYELTYYRAEDYLGCE